MAQSYIVVGNPRPGSRTREVAERLAAELHLTPVVVDLADHAARIFDLEDETLGGIQRALVEADIVIFATPTYKASYTGLLKGFLDRYGTRGLAGVVAIPVMTGGDRTHALAVDTALRPLLVELGASLPTGGLYIPMSEPDAVPQRIAEWIEQNSALVAAAVNGASA